jgi:hypothetical protein
MFPSFYIPTGFNLQCHAVNAEVPQKNVRDPALAHKSAYAVSLNDICSAETYVLECKKRQCNKKNIPNRKFHSYLYIHDYENYVIIMYIFFLRR